MTNLPDDDTSSTRREALRTIGTALALAPLGPLLGCGSGGGDAVPGRDGGDGDDGGGRDAAPDGPVADAGAEAAADAGPDGGGWATGGTASMSGDYRDPFAAGIGDACALTCAATLGPCYAETLVRQDISEGQPGLPVRMAFLVVDEACNPIEGAEVDIWHTSPTGLYSGEDAVDMCTLGDAAARAGKWFRGVQVTDANGRADFDTCFPGWYRGRTIHIHFTVRRQGAAWVTSQLYFDDALNDEVLGTQPIYADRGERTTTNQNDSVISPDAVAEYSFATERQADGALLAWKALVLRGSLATPLCAVPR